MRPDLQRQKEKWEVNYHAINQILEYMGKYEETCLKTVIKNLDSLQNDILPAIESIPVNEVSDSTKQDLEVFFQDTLNKISHLRKGSEDLLKFGESISFIFSSS